MSYFHRILKFDKSTCSKILSFPFFSRKMVKKESIAKGAGHDLAQTRTHFVNQNRLNMP
jgi:hypothetical protein